MLESSKMLWSIGKFTLVISKRQLFEQQTNTFSALLPMSPYSGM